ncbi:MAG: hypothetical protein NDI69_01135 [Bacteriovoracaceae bacterium]|nr:hypothetical protein [Bacteriovoracaceae bacterium]
MRLDLFTMDVPKIQPFLETVLQDGGRKLYNCRGKVQPLKNIAGMSGFDYQEDGLEAQLLVGLILGGTGYVLKRTLKTEDQLLERHDYFNIQGDITFSSDREALKPIIVDFHEMDLTCPVLNHLYNFLSLEYKKASEGKSQTKMVHSVEKFLRDAYHSKIIRLPIQDRTNDPAIVNIYNKILATEMDPVLDWEERQLVFKNYKDELKVVLETKIRAHKLSTIAFKTALISKNAGNFLARLIARPFNNLKGLLHRYTIGKIIWFFQTVRNNLGYSIALAVYGPFTYYFITMPMNPHAMQAVGHVRSAYLETKTEISRLLDQGEVVISDMRSKEAVATTAKVNEAPKTEPVSDAVSTTQAAPKTTAQEAIMANIIDASAVTADKSKPLLIKLGDGSTESATPSFLNMLLTTDSEKINKTSWSERMSNFKQLQIAYEENIEYASRMGRLEQLETQYNFPMQIESTWEELERYNNLIFKLRAENPNLSAKMKQYLFNEINRTQQLELYLWDRMGRFILDQIYVMLDQDNEQKRSDYYVGRAFVFMEEMTNILSWRYKDLKRPEGYENIQKLAEAYAKARKETGTVLNNLQANSNLFKQKDVYDTKEFRSHMKRQWEILFLQNSKAEEASNMGLNMYIWSVRNTAWVLQSMYSAKRDELALLIKRDVSGQLLTPAEMLTRSKVSMLYETLLHNLTLEYVGIREEIMNRIGKDIESTQRMIVIDNLREFLSDRDKLDNLGMANNKNTAGTKI